MPVLAPSSLRSQNVKLPNSYTTFTDERLWIESCQFGLNWQRRCQLTTLHEQPLNNETMIDQHIDLLSNDYHKTQRITNCFNIIPYFGANIWVLGRSSCLFHWLGMICNLSIEMWNPTLSIYLSIYLPVYQCQKCCIACHRSQCVCVCVCFSLYQIMCC